MVGPGTVAGLATIAVSSSSVGGGDDCDSCGIRSWNAATSSSSTRVAMEISAITRTTLLAAVCAARLALWLEQSLEAGRPPVLAAVRPGFELLTRGLKRAGGSKRATYVLSDLGWPGRTRRTRTGPARVGAVGWWLVTDDIRLADVPPLQRPVMLLAFSGWNDAGEAASNGLARLLQHWGGRLIGEIDPQPYTLRHHPSGGPAGRRRA